jgi:hypothetical protein
MVEKVAVPAVQVARHVSLRERVRPEAEAAVVHVPVLALAQLRPVVPVLVEDVE